MVMCYRTKSTLASQARAPYLPPCENQEALLFTASVATDSIHHAVVQPTGANKATVMGQQWQQEGPLDSNRHVRIPGMFQP